MDKGVLWIELQDPSYLSVCPPSHTVHLSLSLSLSLSIVPPAPLTLKIQADRTENTREEKRMGFLPTLMSTTAATNSLLPVPKFHSSISSTFASRRPGVVRCKHEVNVNNDLIFARRDLLNCVGAAMTMELVASSTPFVQVANAADLIQRRQRSDFLSSIKTTLYTAIKGDPELIPSILTLALNDIMTYDKATKTGGPNGSIRFSSEINRQENKGLSPALDLLVAAKEQIDSYSKGGPISYADLIQLAAQSALKATFLASAIRKCGGNEEKGNLLYSAYGSTGQWGLFDRQFGRSDSEDVDPEGRVPLWYRASVQEMKDKYKAVGLGPRQLAVMSAFFGPDQAATEVLLATDPEVKPWVEKYQQSRETVSETNYQVDLITTLTKLSTLGQDINYEMYSYPVQKVDLTKLKL